MLIKKIKYLSDMKTKNKPWFKKIRHSYIAVNIYGALMYIPYAAYLLYSLYIPFHYINNKQLALLIVLPNWIGVTLLMTLFAKYKSNE